MTRLVLFEKLYVDTPIFHAIHYNFWIFRSIILYLDLFLELSKFLHLDSIFFFNFYASRLSPRIPLLVSKNTLNCLRHISVFTFIICPDSQRFF